MTGTERCLRPSTHMWVEYTTQHICQHINKKRCNLVARCEFCVCGYCRHGSPMRPLKKTCLSLQELRNTTKRKIIKTSRKTEVQTLSSFCMLEWISHITREVCELTHSPVCLCSNEELFQYRVIRTEEDQTQAEEISHTETHVTGGQRQRIHQRYYTVMCTYSLL